MITIKCDLNKQLNCRFMKIYPGDNLCKSDLKLTISERIILVHDFFLSTIYNNVKK